MNDIKKLKEVVEKLHECGCSHLGSTLVHEEMDGQTVWKGTVEEFQLEGHPKADRAFAWSYDDNGMIRYVAVLKSGPVKSPREAVQLAILSGGQK